MIKFCVKLRITAAEKFEMFRSPCGKEYSSRICVLNVVRRGKSVTRR
jgi:hypothetical protein